MYIHMRSPVPGTARIGVDVGQGGVRALRDDGAIRGDRRGFWEAPLAELVVGIIRQFDQTRDVVVAVGATGPVDSHQVRGLANALCSAGLRGELRLARDGVTAHLGSFGGEPGVAIAAGTGVVVLGRGPRGHAVVDGRGHELGDYGSGYWIGRACIRKALRWVDAGREDILLQAVRDRWGEFDGFLDRWRDQAPSVRDVAAFAEETASLAGLGSRIAAKVWRAAGIALAESATYALRRSGATRVALSGGVSRAGELIAGPLRAALPEGARLIDSAGDPLQGALLLATSASSHEDALVMREAIS